MSHRHPFFARFYARTSTRLEKSIGPHRATLLEGLAGRVIEIGAGNGLNFAHYPAAVTEVIAVEPEPHLRSLAEAAADRASVPIKVVDGLADGLPVEGGSCDAAVTSLVLCTVPDQDRALAEVLRVLRPGGRLRFFEHVRATAPGRRRVQKTLDGLGVWPWFGGGCHCSRDTRAAIERAGFTIDTFTELTMADTGMPFPAAPQILGTATRP
ncbi:class I SAM-dependent methyltransferase [Thermomonospora umbrina]|uniref:Ubiquinone/menaquinone biosynthesis C-methylase UbiE n=1 Tax=Thermomonospora umbrina TaxID=111806 RepID=A0A3D9T752_9ACTN|nr:class I SAM-dependent methyltransferase [Thermomonospora umbrina]REF00505.1 ubiquinone/menaquinone biosynthesis C-methylase UbiE [Thermomonospora umbrina]